MDILNQALSIWLKLQRYVIALLVVLSAVWSAQITWLLLEPNIQISAPRVLPAVNANDNSSGVNWAEIGDQAASREFFGEVVIEETTEVEELDAPETSLDLTLHAVMAQGDGKGFAIIGQRNGSGEVFSVEEDIFGQAKLTKVFADRVILDRNGRLETLRYEQIASEGLLQPVSSIAKSSGTADSFQEALQQANQAVATGGDLQSQVQGMVAYVAQRANTDPEAFINEMGLQPTEGGYQVTRQARQLQMVGLRPGDIVTAVNDSPVGNIQNDQVLLNQFLQTGGELKIQIRRGSRSFTIYQSIPTF
ncbi:type II secretion system protein N [Reinekea marina]|uniref:Type II secretion system protein N n=1 Tax=Reinekea marina TaxID=1310421 RepID=A0ABV7WS61_9GAMM|nr:type II secretion system protein N [Reinekea marina]MDN3649125.1 type II secretion system protein N [Reinekea marina]